MKNLLEETLEALDRNEKGPSDVEWVGFIGDDFSDPYGWFDWEDFTEVSDDEYYSGFGAAEVATDLVVVGEDWWLERYEYDGSEGWTFKTLPSRPSDRIKPERVMRGTWDTGQRLHEEDYEEE